MGRDELKSKESRPGFPEYGPSELPKVNTMRADKTQPDRMTMPILHDGDVMLCSAEAIGSKPVSCYTCTFQNDNETCQLMGPEIMVAKVTGDDEYKNPIEYWPCCSMHNYGGRDVEEEAENHYHEPLKTPDALGLIWINSSKPGQKFGGANCGGVNGGDDCDNYQVKQGEKWDNPQGFCRVLQHEVSAGQVCSAWHDDDILQWEDAQQLIQGPKEQRDKRKLAREIIKGDD